MSMGQSLGSATFEVHADVDDMVQGFARMKKLMEENVAMQARVGSAASLSAGQWRGLGQSMMSVGYIADDIQYGFRSIVNNIQPMAMQVSQAFGASTTAAMAFGGVLSIVAVGVNQLINHWGDLMDAMQSTWSGTPVEEFRKVREAAEAATKAWEEMSEAPTKMQAKVAKGVREAIVEGPAEAIQKSLEDAIKQSPILSEGGTDQEKGEIAARRRQLESKDMQPARRRRIEALLEEQYNKMAARMLGEAAVPGEGGNKSRLTIKGLMDQRPDLFPPDARAAFEAAQPDAIGRKEAFDKDQKTKKEVQKRIKAAEEVHKKELQLEIDNQKRIDAEKKRREAEERREEIKRFDVRAQVQRRIKEQEAEHQRKLDEELAAGRRALDMKEKKEREAAVAARKDLREDDAAARHGRHLRWQVQDIMKGARPERAKAEFMGFAEFAKSTQLGILNNPVDIQKKQLEALERIRRLLEDNPQQKANIMAAVAAGPP